MGRKVMLSVIIWACLSWTEALYIRTKDGRRYSTMPATVTTPLSGEPTCDDLRVMWRFSRRQSRMAEITNEIPTYRDPFSYNVWEEFKNPRNIVGSSLRSAGRSWNRPVYGKVVQNAPKTHPRVGNIEKARAYEEVLRYLTNANTGVETRHKGPSSYRIAANLPVRNGFSQTGSFQHLKKIIWAERDKELQQQRLLEDAAMAKALAKGLPYSYRSYGRKDVPSSYYNLPLDVEEDPYITVQAPNPYASEPKMDESYSYRPVLDEARW